MLACYRENTQCVWGGEMMKEEGMTEEPVWE